MTATIWRNGISKTYWLLDFWQWNGFLCACAFAAIMVVGVRLEIHVKKSGRESAWQKLIVGKPLQSTYHNGLSVQVCLKIWRDAGGKYLQVGPLQPSPDRPRPGHRVPTPPWPSIVVREWSPFAYKRIYLGRTKTGFYVAQTGLRGSDY